MTEHKRTLVEENEYLQAENEKLLKILRKALPIVQRGGPLASYHRPGTGESDKFRDCASDVRLALGQSLAKG